MEGRKIKIGVLGCSNFFRKRIVDAVSKCEHGKIVCLASRDIEKAKKWAEEFNIESYDSYEGLLQREDIDAVYIPLPIGLHKEWVVKAAQAGKHILCEKSLAESFNSVKEMVEVCKNKNVKLSENFMVKNHLQHLKVIEMIKDGKVGKIFVFKSSFSSPLLDKEDIRYDKNLGGGVLNDMGCYPIFISRFLFKEEPVSVICNLNVDGETGVDVFGSSMIEFSDGKMAIFDFSFDSFYQNNYSVLGSAGLIKVNRAYSIGDEVQPNIDYEFGFGEVEKINVDKINQYAKTFDEFCLDILENRESDFDGMLNQAKVMEALRVSARENRKVRIDEIEDKKEKVVVVSGYFDPLHIGHIELFEKAKKLGNKLVVILNNDKQVFMKRGKEPFMNQEDRKKVLETIGYVDEVFISIDGDRSVCESIKAVGPDIFANGGDRFDDEVPENKLCKELGIKMVDGLGEKIASSRNFYKEENS